MRKKIFLLSCLLLIFISIISAKEVYVYAAGSSTSVHSSLNVKKIIFHSGELNLVNIDASSITIPYTDFDFFSFAAKGSSTSIFDLSNDKDEISICATDAEVQISGKQIIRSIQFYSMQGVIAEKCMPHTSLHTLSLSSYPSGVYMLIVRTDTTELTQKIIVK